MEIYRKVFARAYNLLIKQIQFSLYLANNNVDCYEYCMVCGHTHEVEAIYCWKVYLLTLVIYEQHGNECAVLFYFSGGLTIMHSIDNAIGLWKRWKWLIADDWLFVLLNTQTLPSLIKYEPLRCSGGQPKIPNENPLNKIEENERKA